MFVLQDTPYTVFMEIYLRNIFEDAYILLFIYFINILDLYLICKSVGYEILIFIEIIHS